MNREKSRNNIQQVCFLVKILAVQKNNEGWEFNSLAKCLPGKYKVPRSISSTKKSETFHLKQNNWPEFVA